MEIVLVLVALVAGATVPVQAGVNAALGRYTGRPEWAAFVSFSVGLAGLAAWLLVGRLPPPARASLAGAPGWAWTGGLIGAFYVTSMVYLTPRLGVATTLVLTVAGQMAAALLLDQWGAFGLAVRPISATRVAGAALLVVAVLLIRR
ncbi:DMT family transporter [Anaeromyxobacter oryzae]|uniref:Membrane protein n=1 Tax=Anaeromyxobacter oryzae TaxID=2918170 RepID=A0ABN6MUE5_9BACT|nr:DMT family transporter [Anaeromyxobacter oryzae]BDG03895.1 membrane protein [Anaeromyxobacter oryzae]